MSDSKAKPSILSKISRFFKDLNGERKKIVWPSRAQTIKNTVIVLIFSGVMSLIIAGFDLGVSKIIGLLLSLGGGAA